MSSVTFYKYCGNGFGEERPLEVGQRQAIVKVSRIVTDIIQIFNHLKVFLYLILIGKNNVSWNQIEVTTVKSFRSKYRVWLIIK